MDLLRLPAPLQRALLTQKWPNHPLYRCLATETYTSSIDNPRQPPPSPRPLSPSQINTYTTSQPPTTSQLKYSHFFFHASPPTLLYSASHFRHFPPLAIPEVAFLGRSNVGKSSLLNALFGRSNIKDAHVSKRPGRTRTMNGFGVTGGLLLGAAPAESQVKDAGWKRFPRGGLVVVDMPGYGSGSREDWGKEALKYLEQRKQLRRTFVLVDAEHGLKKSDIAILTHLRRKGIGHQIVLSKVDKLLLRGTKLPGPLRMGREVGKLQEMCARIRETLDAETGDGRQGVVDILCSSAEKSLDGKGGHRKFGVDEIRWSVLSACGMESDETGQRKRRSLDGVDVLEET
ncbi:hypothetical protein LTR37_009882 [Vermiconidia calcicola]|uniref:Uncharacterized protein n=1 Tax=Vermiconidia calcicola TaxID=1690605 RepID=A0ACC3N6W6_9PEZI|nr:hypothetical protein LTR37_009882 [Vermiconidia calcicola]